MQLGQQETLQVVSLGLRHTINENGTRTCSQVADRRIHTHIQHRPLRPLICTKEDQCAGEGAKQRWKTSAI